MSAQNRPLIPVELQEPVQFAQQWSLYYYLDDQGLSGNASWYGLETIKANNTGYNYAYNVEGSGAVLILMLAAQNNGSVVRDFGARITFDGTVVLDRINYPCNPGEYSSLIFIGQGALGTQVDQLRGMESDYLPFDTGFIFEPYNENAADLALITGIDLYLT